MRNAIQILPEETLRDVVDSLVRLVEAAGAAVIFIGALIAVVKFVAALPKRNAEEFVPVRLSLGRFLALGLEFQLASDVLRTAIAPSFQELGKLGAVAAIRTALNFFLAREIHEERAQVAEESARAVEGSAAADVSAAAGSAAGNAAANGSVAGSPAVGSSVDGSQAVGGSAVGGSLPDSAAAAGSTTADSVYSRAIRAGTRAGLVRHARIRAAREDRAGAAHRDGAAQHVRRDPHDAAR